MLPFGEVEGLKGAVIAVEHRLGMTLKKKRQSAARCANIHRLPEPIQHQHMLAQHRTHGRSRWPETTQNAQDCQRTHPVNPRKTPYPPRKPLESWLAMSHSNVTQ